MPAMSALRTQGFFKIEAPLPFTHSSCSAHDSVGMLLSQGELRGEETMYCCSWSTGQEAKRQGATQTRGSIEPNSRNFQDRKAFLGSVLLLPAVLTSSGSDQDEVAS